VCRNYGEGRRATLRPSSGGLHRVQGDRSGYGRGAAEWGLDRCGHSTDARPSSPGGAFRGPLRHRWYPDRGRAAKPREGEQATVPSGTPHTWYSVDDQQKARFLFELRPALNTEILFETLYGLATDGNTDRNGLPKPLQMAVILNGLHKGEIYLATPPIAVQKALFALLSPVGKLVGYRNHYPKYSGADTPSDEGAGPPSKTSVMARGVAMAASLLVASLFLLGRMRRRNKG
jgi:hypothetical protein